MSLTLAGKLLTVIVSNDEECEEDEEGRAEEYEYKEKDDDEHQDKVDEKKMKRI
jgi:hypothetical protein